MTGYCLFSILTHNINDIDSFQFKLTKLEKEFEISILKKFNIQNIRPGHISVYDYYESIGNYIFSLLIIGFVICDNIL